MPPGTAPHEFQASAQQVATMRDADVLITNGAGFEEGLTDTIEAAEQDGVPTFAAIDAVDTLQLDGDGGTDPHFFTDPARMATAAQGIADFLVDEVPGLDTPAFADQAEATVDGLHALDGEVERTLSAVPARPAHAGHQSRGVRVLCRPLRVRGRRRRHPGRHHPGRAQRRPARRACAHDRGAGRARHLRGDVVARPVGRLPSPTRSGTSTSSSCSASRWATRAPAARPTPT